MTDEYERVISALRERSITARFQQPSQLVISRQVGPVWPNRGNSFWVTNVDGQWYLGTWLPAYYRLPASSDIVELCLDCMRDGDQAMYRIPVRLIQKHALHEISPSEFDELGRSDG